MKEVSKNTTYGTKHTDVAEKNSSVHSDEENITTIRRIYRKVKIRESLISFPNPNNFRFSTQQFPTYINNILKENIKKLTSLCTKLYKPKNDIAL